MKIKKKQSASFADSPNLEKKPAAIATDDSLKVNKTPTVDILRYNADISKEPTSRLTESRKVRKPSGDVNDNLNLKMIPVNAGGDVAGDSRPILSPAPPPRSILKRKAPEAEEATDGGDQVPEPAAKRPNLDPSAVKNTTSPVGGLVGKGRPGGDVPPQSPQQERDAASQPPLNQ